MKTWIWILKVKAQVIGKTIADTFERITMVEEKRSVTQKGNQKNILLHFQSPHFFVFFSSPSPFPLLLCSHLLSAVAKGD